MSYSNGEPAGGGHNEAAAAAATNDLNPAPYLNSAIARVVGKRITRRTLISRLNRHLRLTTPVEVIELNGGHFVLTFSDEDYSALKCLNQPWSIPFLCIHTIPFVPDFRPSQTPIHVVHAWIRLHELPIEKYQDLEVIAKRIGEDFVGIDPVTKSRLVCKYARICVTLDLRKPLLRIVMIEGKLQEVEYEGFDPVCMCPSCERVYAYCACSGSDSNSNEVEKSGSSLRICSLDVTKLQGKECEKAGSSIGITSLDVPLDTEAIAKQKRIECENVASGSSVGIKSPDVSKQKGNECVMADSTSSIRISSLDVPVKKIEVVAKQKRKECENAGSGSSVGIKSPEVSKQKGKECVMADSTSSIRISSLDVPVKKIEAVAKQKRKECENAGSGIRLDSPYVPLNTEAVAKQIRTEYEEAKFPNVPIKTEAGAKLKGKCEVSVSAQPLPNFPKQSSTVTIRDPKSKHVVPLPSVEDQFKSALIANHDNQLQSQPSSPPTRIPSLQPRASSETNLKFYSDGIKCSTKEKKITNTHFKETIVDGCPTVYTVESNFTCVGITLSEVHTRTTMVSNENQYVIDIVPTSTGGVGSKVVSGSESCSKMLVWKFNGTENAKLKQALKDLIQLHDPSTVLIIGTKISGADAEQVVQELPFRCSYCRKPDVYSGGVWLLLSRKNVEVEVNSCSPQQVSASVYFRSETSVRANSPPNVGTETSLRPWGPTFFCTPTSWMSSEACR